MSRLAYQGSDYPDASTKHLEDAVVLNRNGRYDGSAYHAGYVVECALKSVLQYELAWNPRTGQYDRRKLEQAEIKFRELSHGLEELAEELGRVQAAATTQTAPYLPRLSAGAEILKWRPSHRYRPVGHHSQTRAQAMLADAQQVYNRTIGRMLADQVL